MSNAFGLQADDGVILVDHGSRVSESNEALLVVASRFHATLQHPIVEPAHMELAEPSIQTAVDRCVAQGAKRIVVVPFFLLPGRHWRKDIPELTRAACLRHNALPFLVTAPLGDSQGVVDVLIGRMTTCLRVAEQGIAEQTTDETNSGCDLCAPGLGCRQTAEAAS